MNEQLDRHRPIPDPKKVQELEQVFEKLIKILKQNHKMYEPLDRYRSIPNPKKGL